MSDLIEKLRAQGRFQPHELEIYGGVPITCNMQGRADETTLTVGDLREAADTIEQLEAQLEAECKAESIYGAIVAEIRDVLGDVPDADMVDQVRQLKQCAAQQLEAQLKAEREECDVRHWRDARQSALEAADAFQAELAYWKICTNCGQPLEYPGLCTSGQDELEQGHRQMMEEWCDERDKLQEQVRTLRAEPSDPFLRACLEGDRAALQQQVKDLNEAVSEAIKDRDYYEQLGKQGEQRCEELAAELDRMHEVALDLLREHNGE